MGYSKRDYTTKEEREQLVIEKGNAKTKSKIVEYMSQPNIREFNALVVDNNFKKMREKISKGVMGRPQLFKSREECQEEIEGYFKLCYDYNVIPTVASMSTYLGMGRQYLYDIINNQDSDFTDILKSAVETCQSYQELPALDGTLSAPTWIFTAKNYFGMKDTQDVSISATNQQQNNTNTINAIKEQLALENDTTLIDTKETN